MSFCKVLGITSAGSFKRYIPEGGVVYIFNAVGDPYFFQAQASVERGFFNAGKRRREFYSYEFFAGSEKFVRKRFNSLGNFYFGKAYTESEDLKAEILKIFRKFYFRQALTAAERRLSDSFDTVGQGNFRKARTARNKVGLQSFYSIGNRNLRERCTPRKSKLSDGRYAVGDFYIGKSYAVPENAFAESFKPVGKRN